MKPTWIATLADGRELRVCTYLCPPNNHGWCALLEGNSEPSFGAYHEYDALAVLAQRLIHKQGLVIEWRRVGTKSRAELEAECERLRTELDEGEQQRHGEAVWNNKLSE